MTSLRYRVAVGLLRRHLQRQPLLTVEAARRRIGAKYDAALGKQPGGTKANGTAADDQDLGSFHSISFLILD